MAVITLRVPRIEDEIEEAWRVYTSDEDRDDTQQRNVFEAGFRAARTFKNLIGGV